MSAMVRKLQILFLLLLVAAQAGGEPQHMLQTVLPPDQVLPTTLLKAAGNLGLVPWKNWQSPGGQIKPKRHLKTELDVLPNSNPNGSGTWRRSSFHFRPMPMKESPSTASGRKAG